MPTILIKHTVADYDQWRPHYDDHEAVRVAKGEQGSRVFQAVDDPNEVTIMFEWDTIENARAFLTSADLKQVMGEAGVVGKPEFAYLEEAEATTPPRSAA